MLKFLAKYASSTKYVKWVDILIFIGKIISHGIDSAVHTKYPHYQVITTWNGPELGFSILRHTNRLLFVRRKSALQQC